MRGAHAVLNSLIFRGLCMNRPITLSLAIALALGSTAAHALGLGSIEVRSGLNEPLLAEIAVNESVPGEAETLKAQLASAADFARVGLDTSGVTVSLAFDVIKGRDGKWFIQVTSETPVREPFLQFLVDASWPNGRVLREYNVLLDPPVVAPAVIGTRAVAEPAIEPASATPEPLVAEPAEPAEEPASVSAPDRLKEPEAPQAQPVEEEAAQAPAPASSSPQTGASSSGEYGPVAGGETLWEIASNARPNTQVTVNQMMLAILRANPDAFSKGNVNALKRGAVLRIPSAEDAGSMAAAEAAAEVIAQNQAWQSNRGRPAVVASNDSAPASASSREPDRTAAAEDSRLELVPPRSGERSGSGADKPGTAGGTDTGSEARAELARTKEQLVSREQEAGELRSRIQELERLGSDSQRLIDLKDSEIADLQRRLQALEQELEQRKQSESASQTGTTEPVTPPTGEAVAEQPTEATPAQDASTEATQPPVAEEGSPQPGTEEAPDTAVQQSQGDEAPTTDAAPETDSATQVNPLEQGAQAEPAPIEEQTPTQAMEASPNEPVPAPQPWWRRYLYPLIGAAIVLLGSLAFAFSRGRARPKPAGSPAGKASVADSFSSGVFGAATAASAEHEPGQEHGLLEQLAADPTNLQAHLNLLKTYYAQNDAEKFEAAAGAMYGQVADPQAAEWQEACDMGRLLVPDSSLFATPVVASEEERVIPEFDRPAGRLDPIVPQTPAAATRMDDLSLDLEAPVSSKTIQAPPISVPELDLDLSKSDLIAPSNDEFLSGEDAIGTKLDLARAYLDMGDPEGARSMLQEVLNEGNELQKQEAQRLLADMG